MKEAEAQEESQRRFWGPSPIDQRTGHSIQCAAPGRTGLFGEWRMARQSNFPHFSSSLGHQGPTNCWRARFVDLHGQAWCSPERLRWRQRRGVLCARV